VAINGGGSTALEEALYLSSICAKVYLIHRRDSFRGEEKILQALREKQNVEFVLNSSIKELIGDNKIKGIVVQNIETGTKITIPISGLFIAIGQIPENGTFDNLINLDKGGYISATEDCKTNIEGIFVAGDTRTKRVRQLTTAASDGAVAALAASEYIG